MLRLLIVLVFLLCTTLVFAQDDKKVETDSSIIETKYFESENAIRVFNELKRKRKTYYSEYYFDSKKLKQIGVWNNDKSVGIWKDFFADGRLKRKINYNKGAIVLFDKKSYPYYSFQKKVKTLGDNIIKRMYSPDFFNKYCIFNIDDSYIYNDTESERWTESLERKPTKFLLRYDLIISGKIYDEAIQFEIDSSGKILTNDSKIHGFEKLNSDQSKSFQINPTTAIKLARQRGLIETDSTKAQAFLKWEEIGTDKFYSGKFRFYVLIKTKSIKNIKPQGRSSIVDKFDVYVFNPWTTDFVEKKKMKTIRGWEKDSGSSSGLLPDN